MCDAAHALRGAVISRPRGAGRCQHLRLVEEHTGGARVAAEQVSQEAAVGAADVNEAFVRAPPVVCNDAGRT